MCKILCSTGALIGRPNNRDYRLLGPLSRQLTCDGFEFMMYSTWYEEKDELVSALQSMKLYIPVMHCEKHIGEAISKGEFEEAYRRFDINCEIAEKIGAGKIVVHLWDGITSDQHFENNLQAYGQLRNIAAKYHVDVLVENVVCNHENPMKHWCELQEKYPDIHFVFDTKMATFHSQLDLLYEEDYQWLWREQHICHYHVNDYAGGHMDWKNLRTLPIGRGHVDFGRFFEHVRETGYQGTFTVESTAFGEDGSVDVEMLNEQFRYIRERI